MEQSHKGWLGTERNIFQISKPGLPLPFPFSRTTKSKNDHGLLKRQSAYMCKILSQGGGFGLV